MGGTSKAQKPSCWDKACEGLKIERDRGLGGQAVGAPSSGWRGRFPGKLELVFILWIQWDVGGPGSQVHDKKSEVSAPAGAIEAKEG